MLYCTIDGQSGWLITNYRYFTFTSARPDFLRKLDGGAIEMALDFEWFGTVHKGSVIFMVQGPYGKKYHLV